MVRLKDLPVNPRDALLQQKGGKPAPPPPIGRLSGHIAGIGGKRLGAISCDDMRRPLALMAVSSCRIRGRYDRLVPMLQRAESDDEISGDDRGIASLRLREVER